MTTFLDRMLGSLWRDLGYGARALRRSPGFATATALCLGLGVGLATAMVTQFQASVFKAVPGVRAPDEVVATQAPVAFPVYEDFRAPDGPFTEAAAFVPSVPLVLVDGERRERIWGQIVTPNYFSLLGVAAAAGQVFTPDTGPEAATQVVLSHRLWTSRFAARPDLVGRTIRFNGQAVTVRGVAAADFFGTRPMSAAADAWITTAVSPALAPELADDLLTDRTRPVAHLIGRLKPGLATAAAEARLDVIARRNEVLTGSSTRERTERRVTLVPGGRVYPVRDQDLPAVLALPAILVALILMVACVNVATMLVARAATREKEIAIRLAIGAGRGRLVRQLLTETLLLAGLGGAAALVFIAGYEQLIARFTAVLPSEVHYDWSFDGRAFATALVIAGGCALLAGLFPALQAARGAALIPALKGGIASGTRPARRFNLRNLLVLLQITASLTLLLLTAFIVVGFQRTQQRDLGFDTRNLLLVSLDPVRDGYTPDQTAAFFARLPDRLRAQPDVLASALAPVPPPGLRTGEAMLAVRAEMTPGERAERAFVRSLVAPGFIETLGLPVLAGRALRDDDDATVVVVNRTLATEIWPGANAVGERLDVDGVPREVVGVIGDLGSTYALQRTPPTAFLRARDSALRQPSTPGILLIVRMAAGVEPAAWARRVLLENDPNLTLVSSGTLEEELARSASLFRLTTLIYGGIGGFGLLLAVIGLAGVTAHAVARRSQEIGIRRALGAANSDILRLVLHEALLLIGLGTAAGLLVAFAATRAMAATLASMAEITQTSLTDPFLLVGVPLLLASVALLACYLPARRALRIEPIQALRTP
ncbi:MAG TPA: FtsX-like permease family protein [Opitutaceae bacterium]